MVESRKMFLLAAMLILVVGVASAQPSTCTAQAGVPPIARSEGVAEEVGQVIINCIGGVSAANGATLPTINVQIFLNTTVTSRLLNADTLQSEALLMIDEPAPAAQVVAPYPWTGSVTASGSGVYNNGAGRQNVFFARQVLNSASQTIASSNSLVWLNVPYDAPGTSGTRTIRLANVRANANQIGAGTSIPGQITMFISVSGTASLALNNPQQLVAYVQQGMVFSATAGTFLQCEPGTKDYTITFRELFGTAFRQRRSTLIDGTVIMQNIPGQIYNTESMFYDTGNTSLGTAGQATQGTRLAAAFSAVPNNVTLSVPVYIKSDAGDEAWLVGYTGTDKAAYSSVSLTNGAGSATWEVVTSIAGQISKLDALVKVTYKADPLPDLGTATVAGNYSPTTTITYASATEPAPRFINNPQSATTFTISSCKTNLLFPFVTNAAGFDTGLVISNTSKDPFGTVTQKGTCAINYYSAAAPPPVQTSVTINAGEQLVFTASGGNAAQNIQPTPGFQGYVIASCNFQYAHGFAFVSDLGATRVAEGYLALVMDKDMFDVSTTTKSTRTGSNSETLKQ